ncbi:hypothetical protein EON64_13845 [archaeon]|nr:MAG: hypothetical protein EON64_13845 [archaeon]
MAEVVSDYFFEAIDEFTFPREDSSAALNLQANSISKFNVRKVRSDIFSQFFKAVEDTMVPLSESTESLQSRFSSQGSMQSFTSLHPSEVKIDDLLNAFQVCLIQHTNSTMELSARFPASPKPSLVPGTVRTFLEVYDEFMHNPGNDEE